MKRKLAAQFVIGLLFFTACEGRGQTISLTYRGMLNTGQSCQSPSGATTAVNGLSGITHLHDDQFLAVMDNSGTIVRMSITFEKDGTLAAAAYKGVIELSQQHDFEGIAVATDNPDTVFLAEEDTPAIRSFRLKDGAFLQTLNLPRIFSKQMTRGNLGFESLTIRDGHLWTSNEEALRCDGDRSTASRGSLVRLTQLEFKHNDWTTMRERAYLTDPIPSVYNDVERSKSRCGVSDLMLLPDGRLLVLERGFALAGPGNLLSKFRNCIYLIDEKGATDISNAQYDYGTTTQKYVAVKKTLLWSHDGNDIGNLEGLALGPKLGDGRWAVVGIIDNNAVAFMPNRVISFELKIANEASSR